MVNTAFSPIYKLPFIIFSPAFTSFLSIFSVLKSILGAVIYAIPYTLEKNTIKTNILAINPLFFSFLSPLLLIRSVKLY